MTDVKVFSPKLTTYWFVPAGGIADLLEPTAAEINAGINLSLAVVDDGTAVGPSDSSDINDRSITDAGNAVEAGFAQYACKLNLFRPYDMTKVTDPYVIAYNAFKTQHVAGYVVKRSNVPYLNAAVAGDMVSVFKVLSDYTANSTSGETSVHFLVEFLPQGQVSVNVLVKLATPVVVLPGTSTGAAGSKVALVATIGGWDVTQGSTWTSSDVTKATVSESGIVTRVASGSATITCTNPSATGTDTSVITIT